jgi:hypothetical protein
MHPIRMLAQHLLSCLLLPVPVLVYLAAARARSVEVAGGGSGRDPSDRGRKVSRSRRRSLFPLFLRAAGKK